MKTRGVPMRWFRSALVLAIAILTAGCDGNPVQPSRLPTPSAGGPSLPPAANITISGRVVDERGNGVAAATVFTFQTGSTRTDGEGRYSIDVPRSTSLIEAKVEYPGYERHERYLHAVTTPQDLLLRDIIRIAPGESRQLTVTPDDSLYGFDFEYRRRTVRVTSPTDATVEFEVVADEPRFFEGLAFGVMPAYPCCGSRITLTMKAGQEVSVHGLMPWGAAQERRFSLVSRILQ